MICWTAGWAVAAFGNCEAGLKTVVTLELDITAAAAAPERNQTLMTEQHLMFHFKSVRLVAAFMQETR